jgi:hypothetical protein
LADLRNDRKAESAYRYGSSPRRSSELCKRHSTYSSSRNGSRNPDGKQLGPKVV